MVQKLKWVEERRMLSGLLFLIPLVIDISSKFSFTKSCKLRVAFSNLACPPLTEVLIPLGQFITNEAGTDFIGGLQQLTV